MEDESNISLGRTLIFLALFAQNYFWVKNTFVSAPKITKEVGGGNRLYYW